MNFSLDFDFILSKNEKFMEGKMPISTSVPLATYRIQFHPPMILQKATELVEYLDLLGVSHCYASPLLKAKPGSAHGYDVVNHAAINDELGSLQDFESFVAKLHAQGMGLIFDMVPNHMYIGCADNIWWYDILENGPSSPYANYFDIDWHPPKEALNNKVLLPLLEQQYGLSLESQSLSIAYRAGAFFVAVASAWLPTDPKSWTLILEPIANQAEKQLPIDDASLLELKSIVTAASHLPPMDEPTLENIEERHREKEVIKKRLFNVFADNFFLSHVLERHLTDLNGTLKNPASFDRIENFLDAQAYRLCFWRVACDEINYRRFFDVSELAGINTNNPEVFESIHHLAFDLIKKGMIDGLRIDHIDGLWDPEKFLFDIQNQIARPTYTVVEKILTLNEKLRPEWATDGTVGYDFLNQLNGLFVFHKNKMIIQNIYTRFTDVHTNIGDLIYQCKKLILIVSMPSELSILTRKLERIAEQHRNSRDFTQQGLKGALMDVIACFPVYRSYIRSKEGIIHEEDSQYILTAIARAKRFNAAMSGSIFDFIQSVLLLQFPPALNEQQKLERENFVMRFQQLTGPVMAKGVEDTAFYRYFPLASLNEVGNSPYSFSTNLGDFHKKNQERLEAYPHAMTATSTHDNKRSEDVRARINVLSEIPKEWELAIERWASINLSHKIQEGDEVMPSANDEYLFYQTLAGTWPLLPMDGSCHDCYVDRIAAYMEKAVKEAKIHTSWINPNPSYDHAMHQFVLKALKNENANPFLLDFKTFIPQIIHAGLLNSLSQVFLKLTTPGIPDIYQGNEIWDFSLVDPDNRRPVDFENRRSLLVSLKINENESRQKLIEKLMANQMDGRIKLYLTMQTLKIRKRLKELFTQGSYLPLEAAGDKSGHIIAFLRTFENKTLICISTRFFASLIDNPSFSIPEGSWNQTHIRLPENLKGSVFHNFLTDEETFSKEIEGKCALCLESAFKTLPFALLETV